MTIADGICSYEVLACLSLSCLYVGSLYIWNGTEARDHPSTIKKRSISVVLMALISPVMVYYFLNSDVSLWEAMGLRASGSIAALLVPLMLTAILFLGPIVQNNYNTPWKAAWSLYLEPRYWMNNFTNAVWCRNQIVAPFSEEFTFRACMLPMLLQCMSSEKAVIVAPLFFGIAHIHHAIDRIRTGMSPPTVLLVTVFQFSYTTAFGVYSAFLFIRTGHFLPLYVVHAFCNHMGLPEVQKLITNDNPDRNKLILAHVLGLTLWYFLLYPLTEPSIYSNTLYTI